MALSTETLSFKVLNSMLDMEIPGTPEGSSTMRSVLGDMALAQGVPVEELAQYQQMQLTWNTVVADIVEHIQGNLEVKLALEIAQLKTIFKPATAGGGWQVVPQDGGAALQSALATWVSSDTDDGVE